MKYERIHTGIFKKRPNRFIAHIEIEGTEEIVHVKNTGRCAELLIPGTEVYVQESANPERKTRWDLIGVKKGERMINMDSQITNSAVREWLEEGNLISNIRLIRPECTYKKSRFDLYVEAESDSGKPRKIFIEVKGVTLEDGGIVKFPDAPSERAVKHVEELGEALEEGYEAFVFFVIQMRDVSYFTPNVDTHKAFGDALLKASRQGVKIAAYDCDVEKDSIHIREEVPVLLTEGEIKEYKERQILKQIPAPLIKWYRENKRELPWRTDADAYRVWVSEIMLQQTRVEAVKPYYERFLKALPTVEDLAWAKEEVLLKLWEGLGYYNRVRNMQKAAQQVMVDYHGKFPDTYEEILSLKGIGSYTAGAVSAFAFGLPRAAVDGNVLRVLSRVLADDSDIMKQSVRKEAERKIEEVIPEDAPGDFDQGLIELGAIVCVPGGGPKCSECPLRDICQAHKNGTEMEYPVKKKLKERRIEEHTVFIFRDGQTAAIRKRPAKGLLAGLYELPNVKGHLTQEEAVAYAKKIGLTPVRIRPLGEAKHIFSHVEWHMTGYFVQVDELEKELSGEMIFALPSEVQEKYPIPSAFEKYTDYINIKLGQEKYREE